MRGGDGKGRRYRSFFAWAALIWLALACALAAAEKGQPGAKIDGLGDALWYSLVTLSTVGYGDVVPVSAAGRAIGCVFVLLSTGLLAALVGVAFSMFSGRLLTPLRLRFSLNRNIYVFSAWDARARVLAENIAREDPNALAVIPQASGDAPKDVRSLRYEADLVDVVRLVSRGRGEAAVFLMNAKKSVNLEDAARLSPLAIPVYCMADGNVPWSFPNVSFFSPLQCCARRYWQEHPPVTTQEHIALIGSGRLCAELLEQALIVNVYGEEQDFVYHVIGALDDFVREHTQLHYVATINDRRPGIDSVFFHGGKWNEYIDILERADRIIVCEDDDADNLDLLLALRECLPSGTTIHTKRGCSQDARKYFPGETFFGGEEETFTPSLVMRQQQNALARRMHELYLEGVGSSNPTWEELSEFTKASNLAVADHLFTKIHILLPDRTFSEITPELCAEAYGAYLASRDAQNDRYRRIEHERFMRFHEMHNWVYAPKRDNAARRHPLLCRFDKLPEHEKAKDDYAWEILGRI